VLWTRSNNRGLWALTRSLQPTAAVPSAFDGGRRLAAPWIRRGLAPNFNCIVTAEQHRRGGPPPLRFQMSSRLPQSLPKATPGPPGSQPVGNRNGILALRCRYGCLPVGHRLALEWLGGGSEGAHDRFTPILSHRRRDPQVGVKRLECAVFRLYLACISAAAGSFGSSNPGGVACG
jgi:hypothetical protein